MALAIPILIGASVVAAGAAVYEAVSASNNAPTINDQTAPTPQPAPAVDQTNSEVVQAELDTAQQALTQNTFSKTILAGNQGYYNPLASNAPGSAPAPVSYKAKLG